MKLDDPKLPTAPDFSKRVAALDGLRGVAILAVFFYHYARGAGTHTNSAVIKAFSTLFGFGWTGVDLFFVLSGFLITGILYDTLDDPGYYKKFYARRVLRIFPIYYLVVLIFLLLTPFVEFHWKSAHLLFLVYLGYPAALIWPILVQTSAYLAITHLWSLSLEEQFYMIWPWIIAKLRSSGNILRACFLVTGAAVLLRTLIYATGWLSQTWAYTFLPCRADALAIGAAIGILVRGTSRGRLQVCAPWVFWTAASTILTLCIVRRTVEHDDAFIATLGFSIIAIMYGALLVACLKANSWPAWLFSLSFLRMFGRYSYGLYLYHFPLTVVLGPLKEVFVTRVHSYVIGASLHLAFNLAINLLIAAASFHFFESPIMRLKDRFNYKRIAAQQGVPA
jgi:peptidoglycan/LPS O-acetylase OafA/YrhL